MQTRINKLCFLFLIGLLSLFLNNRIYAQNSCLDALLPTLGENEFTGDEYWYKFEIPHDMKYLTFSDGSASIRSVLGFYSNCDERLRFNATILSNSISYHVSAYQGEVIYIKLTPDVGSGEIFKWTLGGEDIAGKRYSNILDIDDISIRYGEQLLIENKNNTFDSLHFNLVGDDKGIIQLENNTITGLGVAGTQEVVGIIYNADNVNLGQLKFTVTNSVDVSGKKYGYFFNVQDITTNIGVVTTIKLSTNSDAKAKFTIIDGHEFSELSNNQLIIHSIDKDITIKASIDETDTYLSNSETFTVTASAFKGGILYEEYLSLEKLYNSTGGLSWKNNDNWMSDKNVSSWYGVTLTKGDDDIYKVTQLDLSTNNLGNTLPAVIGDFSSLTRLKLNGNDLIELPSSIGKLSSLEYLNVNDNNLREIPSSINQLLSLKVLYLRGNGLTRLPIEIGELQSLESLDVYRNELVSLPSEIGNLKNLKSLNLSFNLLVGLPSTITNLELLSNLDLSKNQIRELPTFTNFKKITSLNLADNKLVNVPEGIEELVNLNLIYLEKNKLNFEDFDQIKNTLINTEYTTIRNQSSQYLNISQNTDNETTTLSVLDNSPNNIYNWYKDDLRIIDENGSSLEISFKDDINSNFYCRVSNSLWDGLVYETTHYYELGEFVKVILESVPSSTPINKYIRLISAEDNNYWNETSSYNTKTQKYEFNIPKSRGDIVKFSIAFSGLYKELNNNSEEFVRSLNLSEVNGSIVIDGVFTWQDELKPSNTCEESYVIEDGTTFIDNYPKSFVYTAKEDVLITFKRSKYSYGELIEIFNKCGDTPIASIYAGEFSKQLFLEQGEQIYISFLNNVYLNSSSNFTIESVALNTYIIPSIPQNTPKDITIYAINQVNNLKYELKQIENSTSYKLILPQDLSIENFTFALDGYESFSEVNQQGRLKIRDYGTIGEIDPIYAWKQIPVSPNSCNDPIDLISEGDYVVSNFNQYYSYTATEDIQIELNTLDAKGTELELLSGCNTSIKSVSEKYNELRLIHTIYKGESILLKWKNNSKETFTWNFKINKTRKLIIKNIPKNTPPSVKIHAIGSMNDFDDNNQDYELVFNPINLHYEIVMPKYLGKTEFYFVLKNYNEFREVNSQGDSLLRDIDLENLSNNTTISDIHSWNAIPQTAYTCDKSIELTSPDTLIAGGTDIWYKYTADRDEVLLLSTEGLTDEYKSADIFEECGGPFVKSSTYVTSRKDGGYMQHAYLEYRILKGETSFIKWKSSYNDLAFKWSFNTTPVTNASISNLKEKLSFAGQYNVNSLLSDQGYVMKVDIISGNAYIEDGILSILSAGEVEFRVSSNNSPFHYEFDTTFTLEVKKGIQTLTTEFFDEITETGYYRNITWIQTNEGQELNVKGLTNNASITTENYLYISKYGKVSIQFYNNGSEMYEPFSKTYTFDVTRRIQTFSTTFFDDITEIGTYSLPSFKTDKNNIVSVSLESGPASLEWKELKIRAGGEVVLKFSFEETDFDGAVSELITLDINGPLNSFREDSTNIVSIYPNPSSENVTVDLGLIYGSVDISILNATGQVIKKDNLEIENQQKYIFDVSTFNTGIYFINIKSSFGNFTKRLIVK
ncbi:T9SS type A sorting domain-containing protein [Flammeovirga kamogawensis]|uniref:T9SS type A sorting domain-containing protein n=1 Tax=Flammeovirga kamogawensis TaxID=373891 RepID=A0ABX8H3X3_9BACT|nr:T9SS type A sorting domain-containing protein [Flammeovirga kamogawensis]MBB6463551.1 Leucine-rich repeat (LRR) protein [Flammeovirga kamogawensis]QWG10606.1 T9SS type A sorting domain-containing protein [Flammeovirga kamogawensis]TRX63711.1 T9SS type A sorting domain-containing protein [Flammeovirga kamogawensis]